MHKIPRSDFVEQVESLLDNYYVQGELRGELMGIAKSRKHFSFGYADETPSGKEAHCLFGYWNLQNGRDDTEFPAYMIGSPAHKASYAFSTNIIGVTGHGIVKVVDD